MKNNNKHSTIYVTKSDHTKGAAAYNDKRPPLTGGRCLQLINSNNYEMKNTKKSSLSSYACKGTKKIRNRQITTLQACIQSPPLCANC